MPNSATRAIALALLACAALTVPAGAMTTLRLQRGVTNDLYPEGYQGVADAFIVNTRPEDNFGRNQEFIIGTRQDGAIHRGVIRWDVAGLADLFRSDRYVVVLAEVRLGLWYNSGGVNQDFEVLRIAPANAGWVEGEKWQDPCPGAVTWGAVRSGEQAWAGEPGCGKAGVDYDAEPVARFITDSATHMLPRYLPPFRVPVEMVRQWALAPETNAGLLIRATVEGQGERFVYFIASEHQRSDHGWHLRHPELVITCLDREALAGAPTDRLAAQGRSGHLIVIPREPRGSERLAADELAEHLRRLSGAELTILPEDAYDPGYGPAFSLGRTQMSRRVLSDDELADLGEEGYVLDRRGADLFIVGGARRGTLYGVYDFLESLGVRWLTPQCTRMPERPTLDLPTGRQRVVPKVFYRDQLWNNGATPEWKARMRLNGEYARLPESMGGSTVVQHGCHSYHALVPWTQFEAHRDWFAVKEDGKRHPGSEHGVELCLTNPELRRHVLDRVLEDLAAHPEIEHYWVSQDDGFRTGCFCEQCAAERRAHGGEDRWSANTISFANHIARGVRDRFPAVLIKTLAYSYTVDAPEDLPVEDNVLVVICGPTGCWFHPYATCPKTQPWRRSLTQWTRIARNVQTYMYGGPNYGYWWPFPTWLTMARNYATAYEDGVRAMYRQGTAAGYGAEFTELRAYLSARMALDPQRDPMREITEFTDGYYGPAAPIIRQYLTWYDHYIAKNRIHGHHYWGDARGWANYVNDEVIRQADRLFREALRLTRGEPEYHKRVREAYLPILFVKVMSAGLTEPEIRGDEYLLLSGDAGDEVRRAARLFTQTMAEAGYNRWSEQEAYDPETNPLVALGKRHRVYVLDNGRDRAYVVPSLGGRLVRWDVAVAGGNIMHLPAANNGSYPYAGGYEEYSQGQRGTPGYAADFRVTAFEDGRRLHMSTSLANGLEVTRVIELAADAPRLSIASTYRNAGERPVTVALRSHPEFAYDVFEGFKLYVPGADGEWQAHDLAGAGGAVVERSFEVAKVGGRAWLLGDPEGNRGLAEVFDPAQVHTLYAFSGKAFGAMNLELWGPQGELKPGEERALTHAYEYVTDLRGYLVRTGGGD